MKKKNKKLYNFTEKQRRKDRTQRCKHITNAPASYTNPWNKRDRIHNRRMLKHVKSYADAYYDYDQLYFENKPSSIKDFKYQHRHEASWYW